MNAVCAAAVDVVVGPCAAVQGEHAPVFGLLDRGGRLADGLLLLGLPEAAAVAGV